MNIELRLLAVMLKTGDFGPIIRDEITKDHFETDEGQSLYLFITTYRSEADGAACYPSLAIVRNRFAKSSIELVEPDPGDNVQNLSAELRVEKFRSDLRQFATQAEDIANAPEDPLAAMSPVLSRIRRAAEAQQRSNHVSLATGVKDVYADYKNGEILPNGVPWPWPSMTTATRGLHKQEFLVLAGRPKSRKTFTALRIGVHAVQAHNQRLLVFSPEMPVRQMFLRCIAHMCNLPYREFKDGSLDPADEARLSELADTYGRLKGMDDEAYAYHLIDKLPDMGSLQPSLDIVQSTGRDTAWMAAQIEIYKPTIIVADSFYRQRAQGSKKNDTDWKAISSLSREMKDMIMQTGVIGIGTHQLNRGAERSVGDLSSLALADAIGADADGIYRVVTGKVEGEDVSALLNLGGREVPFDGVMINNKPCYDYSELGIITSKKQVADLMNQEEETAAKDQNEKIKENMIARATGAKGPRRAEPSGRSATTHRPRRALDLTKSRFCAELEVSGDQVLEASDS